MSSVPNNIPEKTVERLSEYRRTLLRCHKQGITHIFSHVLAAMHGITAVQVRRDLMLIGFSSDTKKGYDVKVLIDFISSILDSEASMNIAVIGMGHLGQAITRYFNSRGLKLRITASFDIDPSKVGTMVDDIPCYHMDEFEERVQQLEINIVVLSSPTRVASELVIPIINAGIKGVLNFTSKPLNFPPGIVVENYDITTLLEKVAYFVKENEENNLDNNQQ
ncbi:MAG: redox-sensing transcriptional repressor Rex [Rikenellaceae bacterium]|nr:redox-sensing transcriptional repressor Rex [Rikenellaceae bacterium]